MYSHNLLKRFVKDYSLPIQLVREPYFSYYIDLYDKVYDSKNHFDRLKFTLEQFGNDEEKFFQYCKEIMDAAIQAVKDTPEFQAFINDRLDKYAVTNPVQSSKTVYHPDYDDCCFLSIDLKKANYYSLKFYHPNIVLNTTTFDEFISRFTDLDYIRQSKYIRQVIFGNLSPKKQQKIQKYVVHLLAALVLKHFDADRLRTTTFDEIVVELSSPQEFIGHHTFQEDVRNFAEKHGIELNMSVFRLKQLKPFSYFVKEYVIPNGKTEFKAVNIYHMPQVYKHYFHLPLHEYDLMFYHEGSIAKYIEPLAFEA